MGSSKLRIVAKDGRIYISGMPARVAAAMPPKSVSALARPPRANRGGRNMLWKGVDIALEYFNSDDSQTVSALTTKARTWADRYFNGYPYAANPPTALLRTFPDLFNLDIEGPLRLVPTVMSPPSSPEPEGASPQELRRGERRAMNTEPFPEFTEPTLAPESELDRIVDIRAQNAATKPKMRVDASMLRGSGLMGTLPEFLGQLARANVETERMRANNPDAVLFELDDDQAASQQHVEMNLFSGVFKNQRQHQPDILLPGGLAAKGSGSSEGESSEGESSEGESSEDDSSEGEGESSDDSTSTAASLRVKPNKRKAAALETDEDSSDETDASTSTAASLRANLKKRKTAAVDVDQDSSDDSDASLSEEAGTANKIRLPVRRPTSKDLRYFDMKRRKLVNRPNPPAAHDNGQSLPGGADRSNSAGSESSFSPLFSASPVPITKIRVPSRSPDGSRSTSPDRIIHLRHPVVSQSSRPSSSSSSSSSSSGGSSRSVKIKLVQKEGRGAAGGKRLIEEVE